MTNLPGKSPRRYDVDWLRVIAICGLVMIHTAAMFDPYPPTAIKGRSNFALILFSTFLHAWRLAILFLVAGASAYFALGFLTGRQFVKERFKRIVIPLVVGTFLVVPVQLYYAQFMVRGYSKSYLEFYQTILYLFFRYGYFGTGIETLYWAHLWFLGYLFGYSLIVLPLFLYWRRGKGQGFIQKLSAFLEKPGAIFLLAVPLILAKAGLRGRLAGRTFLIIDDWGNFFFYLFLFVYGFLIFSNDKIRLAIERHRVVALIAGIIASAIYLIVTFTGNVPTSGYNLNWLLYVGWRTLNAWFWCVAVLGFGSRYLNFNHKWLPYANRAVYPVYIFHLPISTMIAYQVLRWPIPTIFQFGYIVVATLAVSLALYEFVLRRTSVTRFLFGLRSEKPKVQVPAPTAPAESAGSAVTTLPPEVNVQGREPAS